MDDRSKFSALFILGLGHSGSTLLGRMLGSHPDAVYVGELLRLEEALSLPDELCSCGASVAECPVWQRRVSLLPKTVMTGFKGWNLELIERLRCDEKKMLLVDSSKSRVLRLKSKWNNSKAGYILIVRDPRGSLRAALQRGGNLQKLLKTNGKWMRRYELFAQQNPSTCFTVFYEDLVASAEIEIQKLCAFLGLSYRPEMCHPDHKTFHLIRASSSPFLKGANKMSLDLRWQSALTPDQIEAITSQLGELRIFRERYGLQQAEPSNTVVSKFARLLKKLKNGG